MKNSSTFPRAHRLTHNTEFKTLFSQALKKTGQHLLALYKPNGKKTARIGIIVGKRVAARAVTRNKIKRVIRESFRCYQTKLSGLDIIIIARQQCDTLDKSRLREGIDKLWEKLPI